MSETPRTDASVAKFGYLPFDLTKEGITQIADAEDMRKLERELSAAQAKLAELERDGPIVDGGCQIELEGDDRPVGEWKERRIPMRQALEEAEQAAEFEAHEADKLRKRLAELTAPGDYDDLISGLRNVGFTLAQPAATAIEQLQARVRELESPFFAGTDELPPEHFSEASKRNWFIGYWKQRAEQAEARLAEYKDDAERYRHMKDMDDSDRLHMIATGTDNWDVTIDAARRKEGK